ncbi:MAG: pyridoxal phosphate-dependent aminotransferase [bacterium]|jgi:aminotransferase
MSDMERFVAERAKEIKPSGIRAMLQLASGMDDAISLGLGEPDFDTPPHIIDAAFDAAKKGMTHYSDSQGILPLREAIAAKLKEKNGIKVTPAEVMVTVGGGGGLSLVFLNLLNPGDEVITADPCYTMYFPQLALAGAIPVTVTTREENSFRIKAADIEAKITPKTKMIIINSPQNPTGSVMAEAELAKIAEIARKHDLLVLSDEAYEEFIYGDEKHCSIASLDGMKDRTLTINTFSKTFAMTGWRLGYIAANKAFIDRMTTYQGTFLSNPCTFLQAGAAHAIQGSEADVKQMIAAYTRRRDIIVDGLNDIPGITCRKPEGAFYAFPNISKLGKSWDVAVDFIQKAHVVSTPGTAFGAAGEGYLRMSYANSEENLIEALRRIKEVVIKHYADKL